MTAAMNKTYDVFISHVAADSNVARAIADGLASVGLEAFRDANGEPGANLSEAIWDALAESRAFIALISPDTPTSATAMVELGAAAAWNKPIFLLLNGPSSARLPKALAIYPVYPLSRLEEVIQAIRSGFEPLTEEER